MGEINSEVQEEATRRYVNLTDQISVRTEKGNLEFIKAHVNAMGETMGEFVNRAISEAIYRDRGESLIETTHSDEYDVSGKLLLSADGYYEIDYIADGVRTIKKLDRQKDVPSGFISDYAWMSLENEYENKLLDGK
ncbi:MULTISPECIES: hypothetical protein [unclassified Butyrivibrio]|uniref:hypothetical protein n=1 Tax=unclassified Butyrivibrio TaxID=2639466 RepID=UPI00068CAFD9|nr:MULTISPECIES: hypothetical protein [unclassified Butyrivibrio]